MKRSIILALFVSALLAACGGGSGNGSNQSAASTFDGNAWMLVGIKPANASQTVSGNDYISTQEWVSNLMLTNSSPYNFQTVYSVTIPNVQMGNVIDCNAQVEVTNNLGYTVQIDRVIAYGTVNDSYPVSDQPITAGNVTSDMHHLPINWNWRVKNASGTVTISLDLAAASTSAGTGAYVTVEQGYGYIDCHLMAS
jgi:hypothetical protein